MSCDTNAGAAGRALVSEGKPGSTAASGCCVLPALGRLPPSSSPAWLSSTAPRPCSAAWPDAMPDAACPTAAPRACLGSCAPRHRARPSEGLSRLPSVQCVAIL